METMLLTFFNVGAFFLLRMKRTEWMMVRWMCGMSLKDRKRSVDLYRLLDIHSVADVVRHGRLRWFGHLERRSVDDWVSAIERWRWQGWDVRGGKGRLGKNVWMMTWKWKWSDQNTKYCILELIKIQYTFEKVFWIVSLAYLCISYSLFCLVVNWISVCLVTRRRWKVFGGWGSHWLPDEQDSKSAHGLHGIEGRSGLHRQTKTATPDSR